MDFQGVAEAYGAIPPHPDEWAARSKYYMWLVNETLGDNPVSRAQQALNLERELERTFCAGAWVATVTLAAAVVEVHAFSASGKAKREIS